MSIHVHIQEHTECVYIYMGREREGNVRFATVAGLCGSKLKRWEGNVEHGYSWRCRVEPVQNLGPLLAENLCHPNEV